MNINALIHASPLFFEIEDSEVAFIMKQCHIKEYKKQAVIFKEGSPTEQLFLVLDGKVLLQKNINTTNIRIDEMESGDIFGITVFSEEKMRDHEAIATSDTYILEIDYLALERLYDKKPKLFGILMLNIVRLLAKRLLKANNAMFNIAELTQNMAKEDSGHSGQSARKPHVYLIEDDADVRGVAEGYLRSSFEITCFENPLQAVEAIEQGKLPDIFVTDFMMPEMTGIEFTEFLKEEKIDVPVVFVTGVNQFTMATSALNLGVFSLIEKPFTEEQLLHNVKGALKEHFLVAFNRELLSQYSTLFQALAKIMQSLDNTAFIENLRELVSTTHKNYQKINEKKAFLSLFYGD